MTKKSKSKPQTQTLMELRKRLGLSQEEFAAELAKRFKIVRSDRTVTKKSISDWETGRHQPRLTPIETLQVCDLLQCSLTELAIATTKEDSIEA